MQCKSRHTVPPEPYWDWYVMWLAFQMPFAEVAVCGKKEMATRSLCHVNVKK